jgi:hypothetical protein
MSHIYSRAPPPALHFADLHSYLSPFATANYLVERGDDQRLRQALDQRLTRDQSQPIHTHVVTDDTYNVFLLFTFVFCFF